MTRLLGRAPTLPLTALAAAAVAALHLGAGGTGSAGGGRADTVPLPDTVTEEFVARRCGVCHAAPEPDVLPQSGWRSFLSEKRRITARFARRRGLDEKVVPGRKELRAVEEYYVRAAPTQRELIGAPDTLLEPAGLFEPAARRLVEGGRRTEGYIDVFVDDSGLVAFSDVAAGGLRFFDPSGEPAGFVASGPMPARIEPSGDDYLVAHMAGRVVRIDVNRQRPGESEVRPLLEDLDRPIRAYPADVAGTRGILVEEFGTVGSGGLKFWPRDDFGNPDSLRTLLDAPGLVETALADLNGDGGEELVALVSQASERLLVLPDASPDTADAVEVFRGHPGYGFNGLLLADVDGDRLTDLVTTNGDNYDIDSGPYKPYHGVRVFLNQGDLQFSDPIFLPLHGVIDVVGADFDLDDDLDLLALSSFPDHRVTPYRSAVLFEQIGPRRFLPRVVEPARGSRWVTGAASDLDGDGDPDLVLGGSHSRSSEADRRWTERAGPKASKMLILENTTRE